MRRTNDAGSAPTLDVPLAVLRRALPELRQRFSVRRIGLFGSQVRGEATSHSDLDVLVEFEQPTFDHYMDLKFFLEELFHAPVDLVLGDSLKPRIRPSIDRETVYA